MTPHHSCINCHFFTKEYNQNSLEILDAERESIKKDDFTPIKDHYSLCCHYGVWDEGHNFDKRSRYKVIVQTNREDSCFFFKHRPGMFLPAARILYEKEAMLRETSQERKLTLIGIWIAAIALIINAILGINDCSRKSISTVTSNNTPGEKP
jgi:hypothetical protein